MFIVDQELFLIKEMTVQLCVHGYATGSEALLWLAIFFTQQIESHLSVVNQNSLHLYSTPAVKNYL